MFIAPSNPLERNRLLEVAAPFPRGETVFRLSRTINISSLRDESSSLGNLNYLTNKGGTSIVLPIG